ncbi:MAG: NAD(P)/FAD-dependent oxidoreductase, partial [Propionibacteriales bacterium]|nr:NAD(P)/FAD-dependent oxidoreductase [Propionibacteriales bacterium]
MGRVVIVGGGLAGASTAEALREDGYDGEVVLLAAEPHLPYDRPPLSKGFLKGETALDEVTLHDQQWYDDQQITVRTGVQVTGITTSAREVTLEGGERIGYDTLVLATGSEPRRLTLPGAELDGVLTLRRLEDSERLKDELARAEGRRLVLIGGGWIGLEVGSAFRDAGAEVTVLEHAEQPLLAALGPVMGAYFADLHRRHGTDVRTGATVRSIKAGSNPTSVGSVVLGDGTEVPADLVLVGVGATPRTELAETAGLEVDNGIVVDAQGRTSDPTVFATGDIANFPDPVFGRIRIEHWAHALNHPKAVA